MGDGFLNSPDWDMIGLEFETERFLEKASKRIRILNSHQNGGIGNWIQRWNTKRKVGKAQNMFEALLPRLKYTESDVRMWMQAISERLLLALQQGKNVRDQIEASIQVFESRLDFYDDLSNDCRQINFDISKQLDELRGVIAFYLVSLIKVLALMSSLPV